MNPRVEVKTNEERRADASAYYYKNREKILEKKRKERGEKVSKNSEFREGGNNIRKL